MEWRESELATLEDMKVVCEGASVIGALDGIGTKGLCAKIAAMPKADGSTVMHELGGAEEDLPEEGGKDEQPLHTHHQWYDREGEASDNHFSWWEGKRRQGGD